ncbi:tetratricopeptide repeat protein [Ornithinibacillus scapharcae]|uniref:tetratricopeptide repeat protein n=1 Tax=Ornithinibacillus scapharcae TaxID=1147159 RepID=UPI000225BA4C|nr:tetratricopeptide repeat protein [Ornithinibacillus scapharcae]
MDKLEYALVLRKKKKLKESNSLLIELTKEHPHNPEYHYQCAWSFDVLGEEAKAVPYYERAIELGLNGKSLEGAIVGLGSTYRTIGDYENSKRIFEKGLKLFPNNQAIKAFFSMTLYNLKQHDQAMELLLNCLIETTADNSIRDYERAIRYYSDKLDQIW